MLHYALPRSHNERLNCLKISLELVWSLQTTNGRSGNFIRKHVCPLHRTIAQTLHMLLVNSSQVDRISLIRLIAWSKRAPMLTHLSEQAAHFAASYLLL